MITSWSTDFKKINKERVLSVRTQHPIYNIINATVYHMDLVYILTYKRGIILKFSYTFDKTTQNMHISHMDWHPVTNPQ